jgi:hypothetical protein
MENEQREEFKNHLLLGHYKNKNLKKNMINKHELERETIGISCCGKQRGHF